MKIPVIWNKKNSFCVARVHYTADPDKNTPEWLQEAKKGTDDRGWAREYEITYDVFDGKPVFGSFGDKHIQTFEYNQEKVEYVYRGWDFGFHHPAVVFAFFNKEDQLCVRHEILGDNEFIKEFAERVKRFSLATFPGAKFLDACDPAGSAVKDVPDTSIQVLNGMGIQPVFRKSLIDEGLEIIRQRLILRNDGKYGMLIHPDCKILIDAMKGGYRYAERKEGSAEKEEPLKDGYFEHLCDSLRYLCINFLEVAPTPGLKVEQSSNNEIMVGSKGLGIENYF